MYRWESPTLIKSHPPQLPLRHRPPLRRHQIPERVRGIIPADAILVTDADHAASLAGSALAAPDAKSHVCAGRRQ